MVRVTVLSKVTLNQTIGKSFNLCQGEFRLGIRSFSIERIANHWNRLPTACVAESHVGAALRLMA